MRERWRARRLGVALRVATALCCLSLPASASDDDDDSESESASSDDEVPATYDSSNEDQQEHADADARDAREERLRAILRRRPIFAARFGGALGFATLEHTNYWVADVSGVIRVGPVRADLRAPFRFAVDGFAFRTSDYDSIRGWARIPQCVRVDIGDHIPADDRFDPTCNLYPWIGRHNRWYFNARVSPISNLTLGHGTLMFAYRNSINPDYPQLGGQSQFDLFDWGSAQYMIDDIANPHVMAGRVLIRPLQLFGRDWDLTPDDVQISASIVTDLQAPLHLQSAFGRPILDRYGNLGFTTQQLTAINVDAHGLWIWNYSNAEHWYVGLFGYADYNRFLEVPDSDAFHTGARFVFVHNDLGWEVRAGAEYRFMGNRYLPTYFDTGYVEQAQRFALNDASRAATFARGLNPDTATKLEYMLALPGGYQHGFQTWLEAMIPIPLGNGRHTQLPIRAFVEQGMAQATASASLLIGPVQLDQLTIGAQYLRRNFGNLGQIFELDGTLLRLFGSLYLGGSRDSNPNALQAMDVLRNIAINLRYDRHFFARPDGAFDTTNDFVVTLGYSQGVR